MKNILSIFLTIFIGSVLFLGSFQMAMAYTPLEVCQNTATSFSTHYETGLTPSGSSASTYYNIGFDYSCDRYYDEANFTFFSCSSSLAPSSVRSAGATATSDWLTGCVNGVNHGKAVLEKLSEYYGISYRGSGIPYNWCEGITDDYYTGSSTYETEYRKGCEQGFFGRIVSVSRLRSIICPEIVSDVFDDDAIAACMNGFSIGSTWAQKGKDLLGPGANTPLARDSGCVSAQESSGLDETGYLRGCVASFTSPSITCPSEIIPISTLLLSDFNYAYEQGCTQGKVLSLDDYDPTSGGIVPKCDPTLPPSEPGACGVGAFQILIKNIIKFLFWIIIPIAAIMIGWGGFTIMTSAGSSEKLRKGIHMITIALIGIAIMAVAYLIIQFIFEALDVGGVNFE